MGTERGERGGRASRAGRRERTREKLLAAVSDLLRQEGPGGLSVSAVARRVGVHHSLFYQHFKDVDAALAAAAARVLDRLAPVDGELRRELMRRAVIDRRQVARYFEGALARWMEQRPFVELLLAHRLERSGMGETLRDALRAMRSDLTTELWELSSQLGVPASRLPETQALADLHVSHWLWALECIVEGRITDRVMLASTMADLFHSTNMAFFARVMQKSRADAIAEVFDEAQQQRLQLVRTRLAERLATQDDATLLAESGGLTALASAVIGAFPRFFIPALARRDIVAEMRVTQGDEAVVRYLVVSGGQCRVTEEEEVGGTRLSIRMSLRTLLETIAGTRHFEQAYRAGDIALSGDIFSAVDLIDYFLDADPALAGGE